MSDNEKAIILVLSSVSIMCYLMFEFVLWLFGGI